jgi:uncharacterized protein
MSPAPITADGLFVNLPVADLPRSIAFFRALGFGFDPRFTDASATCMILGERIHVMLLTRERFAGFAPHPPGDPQRATGALLALSLASRAEVDALVAAALAAGARSFRPPEDHGFMYGHAFEDPDGHVWEPFHMDMAAFEAARQGEKQ